jgi:threonyl-tRNA synthetase
VDVKKHDAYCKQLITQLKEAKIRIEYSNADDRLSKRIRNAQIQKIPYQLVIGDEEINKNVITYREYGKQESHTTSIQEFLAILSKRIINKQ